MTRGEARRRVIVAMAGDRTPIIDVGADHGRVAAALGAIATERMPRRRGRADVRWVIADGLRPFRRVGTAIIAGMGARTIARILTAGPRPEIAVLHAQDEPGWLRCWLAGHGFAIDAEALAPEGNGFAEVVRAVPGAEPAVGLPLFYGPRLLASADPHLRPHLERQLAIETSIAATTAGRDPVAHATALGRVSFLRERLAAR